MRADALRLMGAALLVLSSGVSAQLLHEPRVLHKQLSVYRNVLVMQDAHYRCMTFGRRSNLQSCIDLTDADAMVLPYTRAMLIGLLAHPAPKRALVIGLGGGILPMALRKFDPAMRIDTVELDPAVLKVAQKFFGFRPDTRSRVHINDGRVFIRRQQRAGTRYDLVFIDAFDAHYIPEHLLTREFMQQVHDILAPGGVVVANTFVRGALQPYETATYQTVFGPTLNVRLRGSGNRIILAARDGRLPSMQIMQQQATSLDARLAHFAVDAAQVLKSASPQPASKAAPLTDQYSPANLMLRR